MFNPDPSLVTLLQATVAAGASDLHLTVGRPPSARRDGTLVPFEGVGVLDMPETERMVMSLLDDEQKRELAEVRQVDFSFGVEGLGRFRANAFNQRGSYALALRALPSPFARGARRSVGGHRAAQQAVRTRARRGPHRFR